MNNSAFGNSNLKEEVFKKEEAEKARSLSKNNLNGAVLVWEEERKIEGA